MKGASFHFESSDTGDTKSLATEGLKRASDGTEGWEKVPTPQELAAEEQKQSATNAALRAEIARREGKK